MFNKSSIAALRREASAAFGPEDRVASRVEVVSAFIWMRFRVMARTRATKPKQVIAVNLRERMVPQLPVHSFGNLVRVAIAAETSTMKHGCISRFKYGCETRQFLKK